MVYAAHSASAFRVDGCAITPFLRGRVRSHRYSVLKVLAVARMDATGTLWERGEWLVPLVTVGGTHASGLPCGALPQFIENEMDKEAINGAHRVEGRAPRSDGTGVSHTSRVQKFGTARARGSSDWVISGGCREDARTTHRSRAAWPYPWLPQAPSRARLHRRGRRSPRILR